MNQDERLLQADTDFEMCRLARQRAERDLTKANADKAVLVEALEILEMALKTDSRDQTIDADSVEYHLDGPAMYRAINYARIALSKVQVQS